MKKGNFAFMKNPKVWAIVGFVIVLITIPLTVFILQQQQNVTQHAAFAPNGQRDFTVCGVHIHVDENPSCPSGTASISSYQATWTITNTTGSSKTISGLAQSYLCTSASQKTGGNGACLSNSKNVPFTKTLGAAGSSNASTTVSTDVRRATEISGVTTPVCGFYQTDFSFSDNSGCTFGTPNTVASATYCSTPNQTCTAPSVTPRPSPTPINTPTATPIPSDTPTPTEEITPTTPVIPSTTPQPTNTPTPGPSATPGPSTTPNPSATVTPIQPTNPPTSPQPTVIVARPTIPSTGPGDEIVGIGIVGAMVAIAGGLLLFGL